MQKYIEPLPFQKVFDEGKLTFQDIYVPLNVQQLNSDGKTSSGLPRNVNEWALDLLNSDDSNRKVMFIQGEAGRGKSVFCRMFADWVRENLYPAFIPILIRLRDVRVIENNLSQTIDTLLD